MTRSALILLALACGCAAPEPAAAPRAPATPTLATAEEVPGLPNARRVDRLIFGGQPSATALRALAAEGVGTVINLRGEPLDDIDYDEPALVAELGLRYVHLPTSGRSFTAADAAALSAALDQSEGAVLVHCKSGNRVGALWAVHLVAEAGLDPAQALEHGKAAGVAKPPTIARTEEVTGEIAGR